MPHVFAIKNSALVTKKSEAESVIAFYRINS